MNRFRYGMVYVFGLLTVAGCGDDLGSQAGEGVVLSATPTQLFLDIGESKTVDVSATDNDGNAVALDFVVTDPGSGISVRRDSTFLPVYVDDSTLQVPPTAERFRFIVTGAAYNATHFTVTAGDTTIDIPVQVVPRQAIDATINNATPALGEVVTITAAPGTHFTDSSTVDAPEGALAVPFQAGVAPDGSTISAVLPPNLIDAQLTITNVTSDASPGVNYAPLTSFTVTTPVVESWTGTTSNLTPAVNEPVTVTLTGATLIDTTNLILGSGAPTITSLTPNAVTFIPAPGASGLLVINGVVLDAQPQTPLPLAAPITDTLKVSAEVPTTPGTDDPSTAPSLITPAEGFSSAFADKPPFNGTDLVDAYYKLVVTEEGVYTVTMDWDIGTDLDLYVCPEADVASLACDGSFFDQPEEFEVALTPGTYYVVADDFGAYDDDDTTAPGVGTTLQITVQHDPPAAPAVRKALTRRPGSLLRPHR